MTVQEWDEYVGRGWHGPDEPHPEYGELCAEACEEDDEALRALARARHERHRQAMACYQAAGM